MDTPRPKIVHLQRVRSPGQIKLEAAVALGDAAMRIFRTAEKTLGEHGITLPQFDVLTNLAMRDGLTQQELAARLQVTKGNVCGLLDRLEKLGWVIRRPDEKDGRINRLSITPAGLKQIEALRPIHDVAIIDLLKNWSTEDADILQRVLSKLDLTNVS
ncbi:MAG: transcriptional regulator [Phycisphaerales bacterium]|nr:transcriptional regulator [Phycisphaerales bacterium]